MEEYENVVFLDADTIVVRNIDKLFSYPEFSAAPNVYESLADFHPMNSGVFAAKPSKATFAAVMERRDATAAVWRRADQTNGSTPFCVHTPRGAAAGRPPYASAWTRCGRSPQ